jgi:hypothetical protein
MRNFLTYTSFINEYRSTLIGRVEYVEFPGVGQISAKVDTGNWQYNSLHGYDFIEEGKSISFTTVNDTRLTLPIIKKINVKTSIDKIDSEDSGTIKNRVENLTPDRPVVELEFVMGGKKYKEKFSISDRSRMKYPILLSAGFLKDHNFIVDPNKTFIL